MIFLRCYCLAVVVFQCVYSSNIVNLSDKQLTAVPAFNDSDCVVEKVYLQRNHIETIEDCAFCDLPGLCYLNLDDNRIHFIHPNAFNGTHLKYLYLLYNQLSYFPNLDSVGSTLEVLDLSHNSMLASISKENVTCFEKLTSFNLGHTLIGEIPDLSQMPAKDILQILNLNDIGMTELNTTSLSYLPKLTDLYLAANYLSDLPALGNLPFANTLVKLVIGGNLIRSLKNDTFAGCTMLSTISWYSSELTEFPADVFLPVSSTLTYLALNNNLLSLNDSTWFPEWLSSMSSLRVLTLTDNIIETLPDIYSGGRTNSLTDLCLDGNPLVCDCRLSWMKDVDGLNIHMDDEPCRSPSEMISRSWTSLLKMELCQCKLKNHFNPQSTEILLCDYQGDQRIVSIWNHLKCLS